MYANCPYADCWACSHGWYLNGGSKLHFEIAAYEYAYSHTWYAEQGTTEPFPDSPVEFIDQECKITLFKYWEVPEPSSAITGEVGKPCAEVMACDNWIAHHNLKYRTAATENDFQNALDCKCTGSQYVGQSTLIPYDSTDSNDAVPFSAVCMASLVGWHGYGVEQYFA
mmetsp:Transcript_28132/g.70593  ORF Transcript_28132/g.70593 Transcript_28132/m.70593 type:complete len:168 (+) Transcript_28132:213-716(+)